MPKCSDVMTPDPVACEPADSVRKAATMMKQHDVGAIPAVDSQSSKRLVGIVTDRDIVVKILAADRSVDEATVQEAMSSNPVSCRVDDDVDQAMALMSERQVRRMPVVDEAGRLRGIIAQADVATRVNRDERTGEMVEAISEPGTARPQNAPRSR
jgi:CBS domain-containing protein